MTHRAVVPETSREDEDEPADDDVRVITDLGAEPAVESEPARVVSVGLAAPFIKLAALSYGLRRALDDDTRTRAWVAMRQELKRQRRARRQARRRPAEPASATRAGDRPHRQGGWLS